MAFQGQNLDVPVRLFLTGSLVTGAIYSDVNMTFWKPDSEMTDFDPRPVLEQEWVEIGFGYYILKLLGTDFNKLGYYLFRLNGAGFDPYEAELFVEPPTPFLAAPELCTVFGNILDIGGNAGFGQTVFFRIPAAPRRTPNSLIATDRVRTEPDANGNFSVNLLRGQVVVIEIDRTGIRQQFTVPDQPTSQILDLLPPFP